MQRPIVISRDAIRPMSALTTICHALKTHVNRSVARKWRGSVKELVDQWIRHVVNNHNEMVSVARRIRSRMAIAVVKTPCALKVIVNRRDSRMVVGVSTTSHSSSSVRAVAVR